MSSPAMQANLSQLIASGAIVSIPVLVTPKGTVAAAAANQSMLKTNKTKNKKQKTHKKNNRIQPINFLISFTAHFFKGLINIFNNN